MPTSLLQQTRNKQGERNVLKTCEQTCNNLFPDLYSLCVFTRVGQQHKTIFTVFLQPSYSFISPEAIKVLEQVLQKAGITGITHMHIAKSRNYKERNVQSKKRKAIRR